MTPAIETVSSSCLVRLHSHSECRRCREICPVGAISLTADREVRIDHSACIGCGLCLSACPTGVFSVPELDANALLDALIAALDGDMLTLGCSAISGPELTPEGALTVPCIGMISEDLLLALAGRGARMLVLRGGDCDSCEAHARELIAETLAAAQERWPGRIHIRLEHGRSSGVADFAGALADLIGPTDTAAYDRREFLRGIVSRMRDITSDPLPAEQIEWGQRPLPTRTPPDRAVLLDALRAEDAVVFPRVAIDEACDGCQDARSLCDRFCPTGALSRVDAKTGTHFVLRPELCVDCGQCVFVCPHNAIRRQTGASGTESITLKTLPTGACSRCGKADSHLTDGLCPQCARRAKVRNELTEWVRGPE